MLKSALFALSLMTSTEAVAQLSDRYEFQARETELSGSIWWVHGVAIDTQQNRTWWCVYYVNVKTIGTKLECLRRSMASTDIDPSWSGGVWIPATRVTNPPPKIAWSIKPDTGVLEACVSATKMTCRTVQLGSSPRLLEGVPQP